MHNSVEDKRDLAHADIVYVDNNVDVNGNLTDEDILENVKRRGIDNENQSPGGNSLLKLTPSTNNFFLNFDLSSKGFIRINMYQIMRRIKIIQYYFLM